MQCNFEAQMLFNWCYKMQIKRNLISFIMTGSLTQGESKDYYMCIGLPYITITWITVTTIIHIRNKVWKFEASSKQSIFLTWWLHPVIIWLFSCNVFILHTLSSGCFIISNAFGVPDFEYQFQINSFISFNSSNWIPIPLKLGLTGGKDLCNFVNRGNNCIIIKQLFLQIFLRIHSTAVHIVINLFWDGFPFSWNHYFSL